MKSLVRNGIDLLTLAGNPATLHGLSAIIRTAPIDPAAASSEEWRKLSACWACVEEARVNVLDPARTGVEGSGAEKDWAPRWRLTG